MVFWPFKKKVIETPPQSKKQLTLKDFSDLLHEGKPILLEGGNGNGEESSDPCPLEQRMAKLCACIDCSKRGTCLVEAESRELGCKIRYVRACSVKAQGLPTGFERVIVDTIVGNAVKKIIEDEQNWTHQKPREKGEDDERKESEGTGIRLELDC